MAYTYILEIFNIYSSGMCQYLVLLVNKQILSIMALPSFLPIRVVVFLEDFSCGNFPKLPMSSYSQKDSTGLSNKTDRICVRLDTSSLHMPLSYVESAAVTECRQESL